MLPWMSTTVRVHDRVMRFEVTLRDQTAELIDGADAFSHDKSMTTFYRTGNERSAVDCWSVAVAAVRTDEILMIRRCDEVDASGVRRLVSV